MICCLMSSLLNSNTWKQEDLGDFHDSQGYIMKPCLEKRGAGVESGVEDEAQW